MKVVDLLWVASSIQFEPYNRVTEETPFFWIRMDNGNYYSSRDGLEGIKRMLVKDGWKFYVVGEEADNVQ